LQDWDLIVVGAGTAGLPAAIFAAERGARVVVIDAAPRIGGSLLIAHGQMSAAGTRVQRDQGINDTPDLHYEDIMRISNNTADPTLVRLAVDNAAATFDWLMDGGFQMIEGHPVAGSAHEPYSEFRYYWGVRSGLSILEVLEGALQPALDDGRVTLALQTRVNQLIQDPDGAVRGVLALDAQGAEHAYRGAQVLLASGGYGSNPEMFQALCGYRDYADSSYEYAQGIGIQLGQAAGGYLRGREHYLPNFGAIMADDNSRARPIARFDSYPERRPPWEIYVNAHGERFVREDVPSVDAREHALLEQPDFRYWIVFDDAILNQAPVGVIGWTREQLVAAFDEQPMLYRGDSLDELARACGLPGERLAATVAQYNEAVASGDDRLGRKHLPLPIQSGPFYAIRMQGYSTSSTVGLAVDEQLRVIREDGEPIANLYAAGEVLGSGQLMGQSFCGGMLATPALTFGRLLGQRLLQFS
jgi:fumarate reductase flavoprotein subunit